MFVNLIWEPNTGKKFRKINESKFNVDDIPSKSCGVYMIGKIIYDYDRNKPEYMLKVGKSTTGLKRRLKSYQTAAPDTIFIWANIMPSILDIIDDEEKHWQITIQKNGGEKVNETEWFIVSKEYFEYYYNKNYGIQYTSI